MISFDRYFQVRFKKWKLNYFGGKKPTYSVLLLYAICLVLNSNVLFLYGYNEESDNRTVYYCYDVPAIAATRWMKIWGIVIISIIF